MSNITKISVNNDNKKQGQAKPASVNNAKAN